MSIGHNIPDPSISGTGPLMGHERRETGRADQAGAATEMPATGTGAKRGVSELKALFGGGAASASASAGKGVAKAAGNLSSVGQAPKKAISGAGTVVLPGITARTGQPQKAQPPKPPTQTAETASTPSVKDIAKMFDNIELPSVTGHSPTPQPPPQQKQTPPPQPEFQDIGLDIGAEIEQLNTMIEAKEGTPHEGYLINPSLIQDLDTSAQKQEPPKVTADPSKGKEEVSSDTPHTDSQIKTLQETLKSAGVEMDDEVDTSPSPLGGTMMTDDMGEQFFVPDDLPPLPPSEHMTPRPAMEEVPVETKAAPEKTSAERKSELKEQIKQLSADITKLTAQAQKGSLQEQGQARAELLTKNAQLNSAQKELIAIAKAESEKGPALPIAPKATSTAAESKPLQAENRAPPMTKKELMGKLNELRACEGKTDQLKFAKGLSAQQRQELIGYMSQEIAIASKQSGSIFKGIAARADAEKKQLQALLHNLSQFSSSLEATGQKSDVEAIDDKLMDLKKSGLLRGLDVISDDLANFKTTLADLEQQLADPTLQGQDREDALSKQTTLQNQVKTLSHFIAFLAENEAEVAKLYTTEKAALESAKATFLQNVNGGSTMIDQFVSTADRIIEGQPGDVKKQLEAVRDGIAEQGRAEVKIYGERAEYLMLAGLYGKYKVALEGLNNDPSIVSFSDLAKPGALDMIKAVGGGIKKFTDSLIPGFIETVQDTVVKGPLLGKLGLNYPRGQLPTCLMHKKTRI